jgi:hypothetical protein
MSDQWWRPTTAREARDLAELKATRLGHVLGPWTFAGVLWCFYDTPRPEEQAMCMNCGAGAVAKPDHPLAGSAVTLSCSYVHLMRRLASARPGYPESRGS